jgi:soluble lytic murein transglycosylase-like protein
MTRVARAYDIPLGVLYAVGLTETGNRGSLRPFAMNVDGKPLFFSNLDEALVRFDDERKRGARFIDIGCMQINHRFHSKAFANVRQMFDPALNVAYAAQFLKQLRAREPNWTLAVARYHAGPNNDPAQKRYVCAVIANLAASGFGAWTPQARVFCGRTKM